MPKTDIVRRDFFPAAFNDGEACSAHSKSVSGKSRASRKRKQREKSPEPKTGVVFEENGFESEIEECSDDE